MLYILVTYDLNPSGVRNLHRNILSSIQSGQVIIIDNGPPSTLPSDLASQISPEDPDRIIVVPFQGNRGFGAGCNVGAAVASGAPYITLINPDALIPSGICDALLAGFAANPILGIASPQLLDRKRDLVVTAGTFPTVLGLALGKAGRSLFPEADRFLLESPARNLAYRPVDWVSGAVMMIRREAWDAVGGFDPNFFLYYEDIDLCRRIRAAGWEVGVVPTATAIHESGGSQWRPGTRSRVERIYFQSQAYYFRKHHGRVAEFILRAVRLPYLATGLRRWYLRRFGVQVHVDHSTD